MSRSDGAAPEVLPADTRHAVDALGSADLVVGIPSFHNASTVGHVVTAAEAGIRRHFPDLKALLCVSDGDSGDGTAEAAATAGVGDLADAYLVPGDTRVPDRLVFGYGGIGGKGSALRAIFEVSRQLEARAVVVMDADLRSVTPNWVERLAAPVLRYGYEFVAPRYVRHRNDGTITNSLAYPITSALYGTRVRQPIGGEFGMSGEVAASFATAEVWESDIARFGVDLWMTTRALVEGRRVAEGVLGAKVHDPRDPGSSVDAMFREVVGTLFALTTRHAGSWAAVREVNRPPMFGFRSTVAAEPVEVSVDLMRARFRDGKERWASSWSGLLSDEAARAAATGEVGPEAWIAAVFDHLVAYAPAPRSERPELLASLLPLYFARTATFVETTAPLSDEEAEAHVELLVDLAIERKPSLVERWPATTAAAG